MSSDTLCKKCGGKTRVTNTYTVRDGKVKIRRRECRKCDEPFHTAQRVSKEYKTKFTRPS